MDTVVTQCLVVLTEERSSINKQQKISPCHVINTSCVVRTVWKGCSIIKTDLFLLELKNKQLKYMQCKLMNTSCQTLLYEDFTAFRVLLDLMN